MDTIGDKAKGWIYIYGMFTDFSLKKIVLEKSIFTLKQKKGETSNLWQAISLLLSNPWVWNYTPLRH